MAQDNAAPETQERSSVGRRSVLKAAAGVAWTVPTVVALGTTAEAAGSFGKLAITAKPAYIFAGTYVNGTHTADTGNVTSVPFTVTSPALPEVQTITVTITSGSQTATGTANFTIGQTTGTVTVNASALADGTGSEGNGLTIVATSSSNYVATSNPVYVIKDTVPPTVSPDVRPSIGNPTFSTSAKTFSVPFTRGNLTAPTADATSVTLILNYNNGAQTLTATAVTASPHVFSGNPDFQNGKPYSLTLTQTDGANNVTTVTRIGNT